MCVCVCEKGGWGGGGAGGGWIKLYFLNFLQAFDDAKRFAILSKLLLDFSNSLHCNCSYLSYDVTTCI